MNLRSGTGILWPSVNLAQRRDLRRSQTIGAIRPLALNHAGVKVAGPRIFYQSVFHAVQGIALLQRRFLDYRQFGGRNHTRRVVQQGAFIPQMPGNGVRPVVGGRTGDNAVEIVGEALRFHQSFPPAVRTAHKIVAPGFLTVKSLHDSARLQPCFVHRAPAEIHQLLRMAHGPFRRPAGVPVICARGGKASPQGFRHPR